MIRTINSTFSTTLSLFSISDNPALIPGKVDNKQIFPPPGFNFPSIMKYWPLYPSVNIVSEVHFDTWFYGIKISPKLYVRYIGTFFAPTFCLPI